MERNLIFNNPVVSECLDFLSFASHSRSNNSINTRSFSSTATMPSLAYNLRSSTRRLNNSEQCNSTPSEDCTQIASKKRKRSVLDEVDGTISTGGNGLGEGGSGFQLPSQNVPSTKDATISTEANTHYRRPDTRSEQETNTGRVLRLTTRRVASRTLPPPPALVQPSTALPNRDPIVPIQIIAPRAAISPALDPNYMPPSNPTLQASVQSTSNNMPPMLLNGSRFNVVHDSNRQMLFVSRRATAAGQLVRSTARMSTGYSRRIERIPNPEFYFAAMVMMRNVRGAEGTGFEEYEDWLDLASLLGDAITRGMAASEIEQLSSFRYDAGIHGGQQGREGDNTMCVVCLEEFVHRQKLRVLPCSHDFHARCVDKWLKTNRLCPICRQDASNSSRTN